MTPEAIGPVILLFWTVTRPLKVKDCSSTSTSRPYCKTKRSWFPTSSRSRRRLFRQFRRRRYPHQVRPRSLHGFALRSAAGTDYELEILEWVLCAVAATIREIDFKKSESPEPEREALGKRGGPNVVGRRCGDIGAISM